MLKLLCETKSRQKAQILSTKFTRWYWKRADGIFIRFRWMFLDNRMIDQWDWKNHRYSQKTKYSSGHVYRSKWFDLFYRSTFYSYQIVCLINQKNDLSNRSSFNNEMRIEIENMSDISLLNKSVCSKIRFLFVLCDYWSVIINSKKINNLQLDRKIGRVE